MTNRRIQPRRLLEEWIVDSSRTLRHFSLDPSARVEFLELIGDHIDRELIASYIEVSIAAYLHVREYESSWYMGMHEWLGRRGKLQRLVRALRELQGLLPDPGEKLEQLPAFVRLHLGEILELKRITPNVLMAYERLALHRKRGGRTDYARWQLAWDLAAIVDAFGLPLSRSRSGLFHALLTHSLFAADRLKRDDVFQFVKPTIIAFTEVKLPSDSYFVASWALATDAWQLLDPPISITFRRLDAYR